MDGDVADDAVERSADLIVGELLLLGVGESGVRLVVGLGVLIGLRGLVIGIARYDAGLEELALTLHLNLVVVVQSLLLRLSSLLRLDRGGLLERIDLHEELAGFDDIARLHKDPGEVALDLRLHGGGAAALDRRDVGIGGRHW